MSELTIDEPTLLDNFLYYGLFLGAIFQLVCIFAVVFIPQSENEEETFDEPAQEVKSPGATSQNTPAQKKGGKREKKKHR